MKRAALCILIMSAMLTTSFTACVVTEQQAIVETVGDFFADFEVRQFGRCLDFYSDRLRSNQDDDTLLLDLLESRVLGNKLQGVDDVEIEGETAKIWVDIEAMAGQTIKHQLRLVKEDSQWKIDESLQLE